MFKKKITFQEILIGVFGGALSYLVIAVMNVSNEDLYNWDTGLIFTEGGAFNSFSVITFWVWFAVMTIWIIHIIIRLVRLIFA